MHPRVEEQFPIIEQDLAPRPLFENLAAGTLQQDDVLRQVLRGAESDLAAIGDFQQRLAGNDVGLAVGHAKAHARQRGVQPHHPPQQPRQHEPRRRLHGPQGALQFRQADPRIVSRVSCWRRVAGPFPEILHGGFGLGKWGGTSWVPACGSERRPTIVEHANSYGGPARDPLSTPDLVPPYRLRKLVLGILRIKIGVAVAVVEFQVEIRIFLHKLRSACCGPRATRRPRRGWGTATRCRRTRGPDSPRSSAHGPGT